tara:strand:- start:104 stop:1051 length:948 start_codon:yes stop_codon:yes gene_type:complete
MCGQTLKYEVNFLENKDYKLIYKRDEYGFRDRHKELNDIDVLVLGGSTTDQRWIKDEDTWTNQLEERLKIYHKKDIDVVNSGIDGQSTFGHIWNFNNWYNKLSSFSPKYIIFYIGINDELTLSPKEIKKSREVLDSPLDTSNLNFFIKIKNILKKNNGIIYQGYTIVKSFVFKNEDYKDVGYSPDRKKRNYKVSTKKFLTNINSKENFIDNLNLLYKYTLEINAIPIFITQKTVKSIKINNQILSYNGIDYFSSEKKISNIIIDFCNNKELFCINVNELFDLSADDTYDLVHLSPKGSIKLSEFLFDKLKYELKF